MRSGAAHHALLDDEASTQKNAVQQKRRSRDLVDHFVGTLFVSRSRSNQMVAHVIAQRASALARTERMLTSLRSAHPLSLGPNGCSLQRAARTRSSAACAHACEHSHERSAILVVGVA
jgi:hypothetical protein